MNSSKILRVDDRLIHGQVVVGWATKISPEYIVLIDDEIALDELEKEIYLLGVPQEYKGLVLTTNQAVDFLTQCNSFIAVVKSPNIALKLIRSGLKIEEVNLGGMHATPQKVEFNRYIFVDQDDLRAIRELVELGVEVKILDLPGEKEFFALDLLKKFETKI